jgi:hypothetical protein
MYCVAAHAERFEGNLFLICIVNDIMEGTCMLKKCMCTAIITVLVMLFSTVGLAATDDLKELYQAARAEARP